MKRLVLLLALLFAFVPAGFAAGHAGHSHPSSHHSRVSRKHSRTPKKSHVRGSNDGTYVGGHGSSHKGGHYKNKNTNDHYRDREDGTQR